MSNSIQAYAVVVFVFSFVYLLSSFAHEIDFRHRMIALFFVVASGFVLAVYHYMDEPVLYYSVKAGRSPVASCKFVESHGKEQPCSKYSKEELSNMEIRPVE
jgi:hypothetical protein